MSSGLLGSTPLGQEILSAQPISKQRRDTLTREPPHVSRRIHCVQQTTFVTSRGEARPWRRKMRSGFPKAARNKRKTGHFHTFIQATLEVAPVNSTWGYLALTCHAISQAYRQKGNACMRQVIGVTSPVEEPEVCSWWGAQTVPFAWRRVVNCHPPRLNCPVFCIFRKCTPNGLNVSDVRVVYNDVIIRGNNP